MDEESPWRDRPGRGSGTNRFLAFNNPKNASSDIQAWRGQGSAVSFTGVIGTSHPPSLEQSPPAMSVEGWAWVSRSAGSSLVRSAGSAASGVQDLQIGRCFWSRRSSRPLTRSLLAFTTETVPPRGRASGAASTAQVVHQIGAESPIGPKRRRSWSADCPLYRAPDHISADTHPDRGQPGDRPTGCRVAAYLRWTRTWIRNGC